MKTLTTLFAAVLLVGATVPAQAGSLNVPNSFSAGTPAVADEVNANFGAVKSAVDDNDTRIAALESTLATLQATVSSQATTITDLQGTVSSQATTITNLQSTVSSQATTTTDLQSQLTAVNNSNVMALDPFLSVDTVSDSRGPLVQLSGVNLQLVNGTGATDNAPNGLGNLIIGYDEPRSDTTYSCSDGGYTSQATCESYGDSWAVSHKSGSHNLVIGMENNYSQYGGIIAGQQNTSNGKFATVTGGLNNTASGAYASVSGGNQNAASSGYTSVSGGSQNTASGYYASVSGGSQNTASGYGAGVSGGNQNTASGSNASVSGGNQNTASGSNANVSGGWYNIASGNYAHVSGGGGTNWLTGNPLGNTASNAFSSILGGVGQVSSSDSQTIPALP